MSKKLLSFIIVNWNGGRHLLAAIESIYRVLPGNISHEIMVADNGSTDGSMDMARKRFPAIKVLQYEKNYLFAGPVNDCVRRCNSDFIFLLNNDATIERFDFEHALDEFKRDRALGALAPQLRNADGTIQCSVRRFPTLRNMLACALGLGRFSPESSWKLPLDSHKVRAYVEQPMMAALMIKMDCWEDVGPLDAENFPLYFNDVDWCYRAREKGWRILFDPCLVVYHHEAMSGKRLGFERYLYSIQGLYRFFQKHQCIIPFEPSWFLLMFLCAGLFVRGATLTGLQALGHVVQRSHPN